MSYVVYEWGKEKRKKTRIREDANASCEEAA